MRIYRDDYGIPHLRAGSVDELAFLQGRVAVTDRRRQLEIERRRSEGLLAELIGPDGLPWDRFARRARLDDTARRCYAKLDPETRSWLSSYADGVRDAGLVWHPWSSLGVFLARHVLFATFPMKLFRLHVEETIGAHAWHWFSADPPAGSGSNAWAVPGLIAGDPHRTIELPGTYQQVRLACPEFDVAGLTFRACRGCSTSATPARWPGRSPTRWPTTRTSSWNRSAGPRRVPRRAGRPLGAVAVHTETIPVRDSGSELIEIVETARGPLIEPGLSLRTPGPADLELGFGALLPLLRASTVDDVADAFERWVEPVNSVLVADSGGRVLQLAAGRVPQRDERNRWVPVPAWEARYAWRSSRQPMTRAEVTGSAVNANDRRPDTEALGNDFAAPIRARRIRELLDQGAPPERIQMDTPRPADSVEAGRYAAWRSAVAHRLYDHPALAPLLARPAPVRPDLRAVDRPPVRIGVQLDTVLAGLGLDPADLVDPASVESGTWGSRHLLEPSRLPGLTAPIPRTEVSGDNRSVLCTGGIPGVSDACQRGAVARYVWDLTDRQRSRWVVPFGASGDPDSAHFADQLPLWRDGGLVPLITDWDRLTEEKLS